MRLKRVDQVPTVRKIAATYLALVGLLLTAICAVFISPGCIGQPGLTATSGPVLQCDELYYVNGKLAIQLPQGGKLVPVKRNNKVVGLALFGQGGFQVNFEEFQPFDSAYLSLNEDTYAQLLSDLFLVQVSDSVLPTLALDMAEKAKAHEVWFAPFLTPRFLPLSNEHLIAHFYTLNNTLNSIQPAAVYRHTGFVSVSYRDGQPALLASSTGPGYPSFGQLLALIAVYASLGLLVSLIISLLNASFAAAYREQDQLALPMSVKWIPFLVAAGEIYLLNQGVSVKQQLGYRLIFATMIAYLLIVAGKGLHNFRLSFSNIGNKLLMGALVGIFLAGMAVMQWPRGLQDSWLQSMHDFGSILLTSLWLCFVTFGLLLKTLEQYFSPYKALLLLIVTAALVQLLVLQPAVESIGRYLDAFLFTPLLALVIGILTIETDSILSGALAIAIAMIVPRIFIF